MRHRWWLTAAVIVPLAASGLAGATQAAQASRSTVATTASQSSGPGAGGGTTGLAAGNPFCKKLGKTLQASAGAQIFCFGEQKNGPTQLHAPKLRALRGTPRNVNAASLAEDVSPAGTRGYGQSETSIASAGRYVLEAWNDSTGFFAACGNTSFKEEITGLGFSVNGGKSFRDLGGLRNPGCRKDLYEGDPSITAYISGGHTFFYVSSLYLPVTGIGQTHIAFDSCEVMGSGTSAHLRCGRPVVAASSTQCLRFPHFSFCSFLDKDYLTIDPARGRLYVTYTDFPVIGIGNPVDMAVCDIGKPSGQAGPAGGTAAHPVCEHGTPLVKQPGHRGRLFAGSPYMTIAPRGRLGCENEGAYPAADPKTGAVYVAYEYNWASNLSPFCGTVKTKTKDIMTATPRRCLRLAPTSACARPGHHNGDAVISLTSAFIPGYNRFPASDFPRPVVSDRYGTVSMVWNDTRRNPQGDILLQSFHLGSLKKVQRRPVVLDRPHHAGLTFMPAVREANPNGTIDVSWYSRASATTALTSIKAAVNVNPRITRTPRRNVTITSMASNWLMNNSDIVPNFGDYIDASVSATGHWPFVGNRVYFAWADGRLAVPQPFEAHIRVG